MKTLVVHLKAKTPRVERELRRAGFCLNALTREYSKTVNDDKADYWQKELQRAGLTAVIR